MDIYGFSKINIKKNCCRINNFTKEKIKFIHAFDLNLILITFY